MSNREQVHSLFRGSAELGKKLQAIGLDLEILAAIFAVSGVFVQGSNWSAWQPLIAFTLLGLALVARLFAVRFEKFAETCRRESARAYAEGKEIGYARLSSLKSDAPALAIQLAGRLPASTMDDYYEAECPEGEARLREIYANSASHTWRLLRLWAWIVGSLGFAAFFMTFGVVYGLATHQQPADNTALLLDALCSIVLTVLSLRAIEVAVGAWTSATATRRIADSLVDGPLLRGDLLEELVRNYDFERTCSPSIPTWLYKWRRPGLADDWRSCKRALSSQPETD